MQARSDHAEIAAHHCAGAVALRSRLSEVGADAVRGRPRHVRRVAGALPPCAPRASNSHSSPVCAARGVPPEDLNSRIGHSLLDALQEALARGLPSPPVEVMQHDPGARATSSRRPLSLSSRATRRIPRSRPAHLRGSLDPVARRGKCRRRLLHPLWSRIGVGESSDAATPACRSGCDRQQDSAPAIALRQRAQAPARRGATPTFRRGKCRTLPTRD